jgi:hypothetical protein
MRRLSTIFIYIFVAMKCVRDDGARLPNHPPVSEAEVRWKQLTLHPEGASPEPSPLPFSEPCN